MSKSRGRKRREVLGLVVWCVVSSTASSSPAIYEDNLEWVKCWVRVFSVSRIEEKEDRETRSGVVGRTGSAMVK